MSAPTRVYFDVENTLRVPFLSGIQRVVRELSRRLIDNNDSEFEFIPVVYCSYCNGWRKLLADETEQLQKLSLRNTVVNQDIPGYRLLTTKLLSRKVKAKVRSLFNRITHPVCHKGFLLPIFEAGSIFLDLDASWHNELKRSSLLPALKAEGVSIVSFHYDITPILFPELTHEAVYPLFIEHLHAHLRYCDLFICISKNSEKDLRKYCCQQLSGKRLNTTTIKLGADIAREYTEDISWQFPVKKLKYILSVGTIQPRKNYGLLLDAFDFLSSKYPDLCLVIVGRYGWGSEKTIARIREHELHDKRLFWFSGIEDERLSLLYKYAFLNVIPSSYEGFGLPLTEALQLGCVTICSDRGALKEVGGDFVEYFDPEKLNELIDLFETYITDQKVFIYRSLLEKYHAPCWSDTVSELIGIFDDKFSVMTCNTEALVE